MFRLRTGYLISGIIIGLIFLWSVITTLPDGKLHIIHCRVGQGDGAYIKFPDGRDMVVDGGPNNQIIDCLSRHMPVWDRQLDLVLLTHPQKDHLQGLIEVLKRYEVGSFIKSEVGNTSDGYQELTQIIKSKNIPVKFLTSGANINLTDVNLRFLWPSEELITKANNSARLGLAEADSKNILGVSTDPPGDLNDYSLVFHLRYGNFDALFTGDADSRVEGDYLGGQIGDGQLELLKVPHHGSKTGVTKAFIDWLYPQDKITRQKECNFNNDLCNLAVISVGKNSYGHPAENIIKILGEKDIQILRTDQMGDIEVVSDGKSWNALTHE